jgi:hypothetical protein
MESFSTPQSNKRTATCHRPTHSGIPASRLRWIHAPPGYPPLSCTDLQLLDPHHAGTPPQKNSPPPFRPYWVPAVHGTTGPLPLGLLPSRPAGLQLWEERLEPRPAGTGTSLAQDSHIHQPARNPTLQAEPAPALQVPSQGTLEGSDPA